VILALADHRSGLPAVSGDAEAQAGYVPTEWMRTCSKHEKSRHKHEPVPACL